MHRNEKYGYHKVTDITMRRGRRRAGAADPWRRRGPALLRARRAARRRGPTPAPRARAPPGRGRRPWLDRPPPKVFFTSKKKNRRSPINTFIGFIGKFSDSTFCFRTKFQKNTSFCTENNIDYFQTI